MFLILALNSHSYTILHLHTGRFLYYSPCPALTSEDSYNKQLQLSACQDRILGGSSMFNPMSKQNLTQVTLSREIFRPAWGEHRHQRRSPSCSSWQMAWVKPTGQSLDCPAGKLLKGFPIWPGQGSLFRACGVSGLDSTSSWAMPHSLTTPASFWRSFPVPWSTLCVCQPRAPDLSARRDLRVDWQHS